MQFALNENQQMVRDSAKDFAINVLSKHVEEVVKENHMSDEIFREMCDAGFMGLPFAEEYGGAELGWDAYVLALEEISRYAPGMTAPISVSTMFCTAVLNHGTEEQRKRYIPPCISGEVRGSFAFTEPGTGSDPKQLTSTYRKDGDCYVLNGVKRFISNACYDGPILVFAKDAEGDDVTGFIFDKHCKGYSLSTPWELCCNETSPIYDVFMDDIRVPAENVLGGIGGGFGILKTTVSYSKLAVTANCVGNMGRAYDIALKYAKEKIHRGKPITKFPTVQVKIAKMAAMHQSSQLLLYRMAEHANDTSIPAAARVAEGGMVKGYVADLGIECCQMGMTVLGAYGVCDEYKMEEVMRDALHYPIVEGNQDLQYIQGGSFLVRN